MKQPAARKANSVSELSTLKLDELKPLAPTKKETENKQLHSDSVNSNRNIETIENRNIEIIENIDIN